MSRNNEIDKVIENSSFTLGAYVITFRRPEVLKNTLSALLEQTRPPDTIIVVDNGNCPETRQIAEELKLPYYPLDNLGPAGASEFAIGHLAQQGHDWIYWGDEDNPPQSSDIFEHLLRVAHSAPSDVAGVGEVGARFDWSKGEITRLRNDELLPGPVEVDYIGGGQQFFLRASVVEKVGLPDGRLFFGRYEPEYCLRVRRAGYRFWVDGSLMHAAREREGRLSVKNPRRLVSRYSERLMWRRYYRTRNYIFFMSYVFGRHDLALREALKAFARSFFSLAKGPRYAWEFTRLEMQGVLDGYRRKLGRTVTPNAK